MPRPLTPLRESQRRTRAMSVDDHLHECVDQLQHPELFGADLRESFAIIRQLMSDGISVSDPPTQDANDEGPEEEADSAFYPSREIFVVRDSSSFTCLATRVDPPLGAENSIGRADGYDYLALTCTSTPRPVLGVVQSALDKSAYPLLLRQLANLCELAHPHPLQRYDREHFHGLLGDVPLVDLHLVLWESWNDPEAATERTPVSQLTHDLAEHAKTMLAAERSIPPILGDIVCLQMNPDRFDGRVRFDWRV